MKKVSSTNILKLFSLLMVILLTGITGCSKSYTDEPNLAEGETASFTLLQTTDVHHRASGTGASATYSPVDGTDTDDTEGGYARLAAKVAEIRLSNIQAKRPTVLVDSGDFFMGTVYDMTLGDTPAALTFIELMQYDAITLGNHEFDYGPAALASFISKARGDSGNGFTVPIVASNMVTDGTTGTDDDGIEALVSAGVISSVYTKTLANGIKIGFIGMLGAGAESDAPLATPVSFKNDYTDATIQTELQAIVDSLKAEVDVVIAISHSGVSDTDPLAPAGDDIALASAITGIDIIASGHEHKQTGDVLSVTNGDHTTYIFCAGYYGKNLAQLEVTYTKGTGIATPLLTNNPIDDSVDGNMFVHSIVGMFDTGINQGLEALGLGINTIIGGTDSDNIGKPHAAEESGMGNLVADSVRYMLLPSVGAAAAAGDPLPPTVGIVANGVIRNGFAQDQQISFADLYSVLPLGMSPDPAQQNVPGYPLVQVYLTGAEIKNMCQLIAYVIAAEDSVFVGALADDGAEGLLKYALSQLNSDYYLNLSGVQFSHGQIFNGYEVVDVNTYENIDVMCQAPTSVIADATLYPCVVDIYAVYMMLSDEFTGLLTALGIPVVPKGLDGTTPVTTETLMTCAIKNGDDEVKEWQALLTFLTNPADLEYFGLGSMISDAVYGSAGTGSGRVIALMP